MEFSENDLSNARDHARGWASYRCGAAAEDVELGRPHGPIAQRLREVREVLMLDDEALVWWHRRVQEEARRLNVARSSVGMGDHP
jgi:hypothetical protein